MLALLPEDAPQLATLPDLGPIIRSCLVGRQWSSTYLSYLLHGCVPCPHPAVKVPPPDRDSVSIAVNVLLATLIGVYPACIKRPPFPVRAALYARIHAVLTSDADAKAAFALKYQPLLTLALAEYVCHVLPAYLPAEHSALCAAHSVDAFFSAGPALFDLFRQDHIDSGSEPWSALSAAAQDIHERLTRVYRSKCRMPPQQRRVPQADATQAHLDAAMGAPRIVPYPFHGATASALKDEYAVLLGSPDLADVASLHSIVRTAPLPNNIRRSQEAALDLISQKCQRQARVRRTKHVCLMCERRGHRGKPRLCSRTFRVVCQACENSSSSIPSIDMVGRIVTIHGRQLVLSPCCGTIQEYSGTGVDFMPDQCSHAPPQSARAHGGGRSRPLCAVCDCSALPRVHEVVDHIAARLTAVHLCYKHTPPEDWLRNVANRRQFDTACREWSAKMRATHRRG